MYRSSSCCRRSRRRALVLRRAVGRLRRRRAEGLQLWQHYRHRPEDNPEMLTFLVWLFLLLSCWPLAIVALVLYPIVWLLLLPFRIVGIAVGGVLELIRAMIFLPARILRGPRRA